MAQLPGLVFPRPSTRPLWRASLRRMRRRPMQYLLLLLGVALGVAMMVSIDLANGSARRAFQIATDAIAGKTTHRLVGGPAGIDEAIYTRLRREQRLTLAAPVVEGWVLAPTLGDQPMRLVGVDPFAEPPFRDYLGNGQDAGSLAPFLTVPNAVVLSQDVARRYGLALGDRFPLQQGGRTLIVPLVGLVQPADEVARRGLGNVLFTDIASAQEMLQQPGRLSHIDLISDEAGAAALAAALPPGLRLEPAAARSNAVQQMVAAFELNLKAMSLLALVVGMFLIYNTVTFSVVQRRQLFGILRSLGATGGQLFALILAEAALLSLVGALLGLALGLLLGRGMVRLVTRTINDFYFVVNVQQVELPLATLVKGLVIGVGAGAGAALVPAWEAMRTSPQNSLRRSALESKARRLVPWLVPAWLLLTLAGSALLWFKQAGLAINFAGLFAVLIAFALLCPPLTLLLMRLLTPLSSRLLGPLGRMAPRDIARSLSRTSVAIAALMTAVSVIIGVSIMIGSFRGTVVSWLQATLQADVYLSPPALTANRASGPLPGEVVAQVAGWPGVERVVTARHAQVLLPAFKREAELVAVSGDVSAGSRPYAWLSDDQATVWQRLRAGEGVLISQPLAVRYDLPTPPGPLTLMTAHGPRDFPVLAIFYDYSSDQGTILLDSALYRALWDDDLVSTMALFLQPGVDEEAFVARLQEAFRGRQELTINSNGSLRQASLELFDRTFAVTTALQLLATLVAFIGVLSALLSLQLERARELGVLRATGMTLGQLWRLTLLETGLMGAVAGTLAMPTGLVLAWILIYVINVRSFGWTLQMALQPGYFLQALAVAVVAALVAGIYPSLRLGRTVIASAIRQE